MGPLITEVEFARLQALLPQFENPSALAGPMAPVAPKITKQEFSQLRLRYPFLPGTPDSEPCVLFVGQALRGAIYDPDDDYDGYEGELSELPYKEAVERCEDIRAWCVKNDKKSFWPFVRAVLTRAIAPKASAPTDVAWVSSIVAWSNLAKIGVLKGNPKGSQLKVQADLCAELLRSEILRLKPIATIFLTGNYARGEILYPAVQEEGWKNNVSDEDRVAYKEGLGTTLFWTYHPRWMRTQGFEAEVAEYIGAKLAEKLEKLV